MVLLRKLSFEDDVVRYAYKPEKNGESGIILFSFETREMKVEIKAENDVKSSFYRSPIYFFLSDTSRDELSDEKLLVWY
jgi:hypothetical protein